MDRVREFPGRHMSDFNCKWFEGVRLSWSGSDLNENMVGGDFNLRMFTMIAKKATLRMIMIMTLVIRRSMLPSCLARCSNRSQVRFAGPSS